MAALLLICSICSTTAHGSDRQSIFKSTDRGQTWSRSDTGLTGNSRVNAFGTSDDAVFAGTDSGIFVSYNEGNSWRQLDGAARTSGRVISFAAIGQNVYAGTDGHGLLVSPDKGATWTVSGSFPHRKVRCLRAHEGKVYVGTDSDGVLASEDHGRSWSRLHRGLPDHAQIFALSAAKGRLFAGLYGNGLYVWDVQESRWSKVGQMTPLVLTSIGHTLIAGRNPGGLHWSDDIGATWSPAVSHQDTPPSLWEDTAKIWSNAPVWEAAADADMVFAGAASGIYYSEDKGRTWTRAQIGLPTESPGVAFLLKGKFVLAGVIVKNLKE